jgi:hypothetical protein
LENGIGIGKDVKRAAEYYRLSADQGHWEAHCAFGRCLENGIGIEKDLVRSAEYYRRFGSHRSIMIRSWVLVLDEQSFSDHKLLEAVTFENGSRLERIEECAFQESGLKSIEIPSSVVVLGKSSFYQCNSLVSLTFESGSRLEPIEECALRETRGDGPTQSRREAATISLFRSLRADDSQPRQRERPGMTDVSGGGLWKLREPTFLFAGRTLSNARPLQESHSQERFCLGIGKSTAQIGRALSGRETPGGSRSRISGRLGGVDN